MYNLIAQATPTDIPAWLTAGSPVVIMGGVLWYFMTQTKTDRAELLAVTKSAVAAIEKFSGVMERIERKLPVD